MWLATAGHQVTVCEAAPRVGGKLGIAEYPTPQGVFRFDTGLTLLTLPEVFEHRRRPGRACSIRTRPGYAGINRHQPARCATRQ